MPAYIRLAQLSTVLYTERAGISVYRVKALEAALHCDSNCILRHPFYFAVSPQPTHQGH